MKFIIRLGFSIYFCSL